MISFFGLGLGFGLVSLLHFGFNGVLFGFLCFSSFGLFLNVRGRLRLLGFLQLLQYGFEICDTRGGIRQLSNHILNELLLLFLVATLKLLHVYLLELLQSGSLQIHLRQLLTNAVDTVNSIDDLLSLFDVLIRLVNLVFEVLLQLRVDLSDFLDLVLDFLHVLTALVHLCRHFV